jgi:hypothetical protein
MVSPSKLVVGNVSDGHTTILLVTFYYFLDLRKLHPSKSVFCESR